MPHFTHARNIRPGDELQTPDGSWTRIIRTSVVLDSADDPPLTIPGDEVVAIRAGEHTAPGIVDRRIEYLEDAVTAVLPLPQPTAADLIARLRKLERLIAP